jgi:hypothetical protein
MVQAQHPFGSPRLRKGFADMIETRARDETLSIPLDGLTNASVRLAFGGGELELGRAEPGTLLAGTFEGGVIRKTSEPGFISLEPVDPGRRFLEGCRTRWDVDLTAEIPIDLQLDAGANKSTIDLSQLEVRHLAIHTGASDTLVRLPAKGKTQVGLECGFAQVILEVPGGVGARIRGQVAFGATKVDESRFPKTSQGWQSSEYDGATDRVDVTISGGFGAVYVR